MNEALIALGWEMYYECTVCKGKKHYYRHEKYPKYEIAAMVRSQTWSIIRENMVIAGPFWGYEVNARVAEYIN